MNDEVLHWPTDAWPQDGLGGKVEGQCPSVDVVRQWIGAALPGNPQICGPLEIHRLKSWGLTARFEAGGQSVFFKICLLPLFFSSASVYRVLGRHCSGEVPLLLANEQHDDQVWTLFSPFAGKLLYETERFDLMIEAARTLARVQTQVAAAPAEELQDLPQHREDFSFMLDAVQQEIQRVYTSVWAQDADEEDWGAHLSRWKPHLLDWAAELAEGQWPLAPDHVDFHGENILVEGNGQLRIVDWEETRLSCPFFSLDRLFSDASEAEEEAWANLPPADAPAGHLDMGRSEMALRQAYLEALPWQDMAARQRGFDLAMCLAPVKYAYESILFNRALGRPHGHPGETAWFMKTGVGRWRCMTDRADRSGG
jgi:thiamine kinase-like enzyme